MGRNVEMVLLKAVVCRNDGIVLAILFTDDCKVFILPRLVSNLVEIVLLYVEVGK